MGSIFRTADAAGVDRIILTGYTPTPTDRFGYPRRDFTKVSLGAEKTVPWVQKKNLSQAIQELRRENYFIIAIEQNENSESLFKFTPPRRPLALILGNEVRGLSLQALKSVDKILEIPMRGKKESLNVSVAAGITLFTLLHK